MRWNCPHCGSGLAAADEKVGMAWSFSRCFKCGGFALIRRSDANLIKVDRAPEGEPILLPEANEDPTALLSRVATQHLQHYVGQARAKRNGTLPIEPAPARVSAAMDLAIHARGAVVSARATQQTSSAALKPVVRPAARKPKTESTSAAGAAPPAFLPTGLPEPLPEEPQRTISQKLAPLAVGMTGMLTIAAGIYLYVQGQAIWEKSRNAAAEAASAKPATEAEAEPANAGNEIIQAPHLATPDHLSSSSAGSASPGNATLTSTPESAPRTPASTAGAATDPNPSRPLASSNPASARNEVVDQVHSKAMAPTRQPERTSPERTSKDKSP